MACSKTPEWNLSQVNRFLVVAVNSNILISEYEGAGPEFTNDDEPQQFLENIKIQKSYVKCWLGCHQTPLFEDAED